MSIMLRGRKHQGQRLLGGWERFSQPGTSQARSCQARASLSRLQLAVAVRRWRCRAPNVANLLASADTAIRPVCHWGRSLSPTVREQTAAAETHTAHPGVCQSGAKAEGERFQLLGKPSFSRVPRRAHAVPGSRVDASTWLMLTLFSAKQRNLSRYPNQQEARTRAQDVPCCSPKDS